MYNHRHNANYEKLIFNIQCVSKKISPLVQPVFYIKDINKDTNDLCRNESDIGLI